MCGATFRDRDLDHCRVSGHRRRKTPTTDETSDAEKFTNTFHNPATLEAAFWYLYILSPPRLHSCGTRNPVKVPLAKYSYTI